MGHQPNADIFPEQFAERRTLPAMGGETLVRDYHLIRHGAAALPLTWYHTAEMTGMERLQWLQGMVTGDLSGMKPGKARHVNRELRGLTFEGEELPAPGAEITDTGGKSVGTVTSPVFSPKLGGPLVLGIVRVRSEAPGTRLRATKCSAEVRELPLSYFQCTVSRCQILSIVFNTAT